MTRTPQQIAGSAKRMRENLVKAETILLRRLTLANIDSFDFQVRIGFYVVDFVFPNKMLIIEVDGSSHDSAKSKRHDYARDQFLQSLGFKVWRIFNEEAGSWSLHHIRQFVYQGDATYNSAREEANRIHEAAMEGRRTRPYKVKNKRKRPAQPLPPPRLIKAPSADVLIARECLRRTS